MTSVITVSSKTGRLWAIHMRTFYNIVDHSTSSNSQNCILKYITSSRTLVCTLPSGSSPPPSSPPRHWTRSTPPPSCTLPNSGPRPATPHAPLPHLAYTSDPATGFITLQDTTLSRCFSPSSRSALWISSTAEWGSSGTSISLTPLVRVASYHRLHNTMRSIRLVARVLRIPPSTTREWWTDYTWKILSRSRWFRSWILRRCRVGAKTRPVFGIKRPWSWLKMEEDRGYIFCCSTSIPFFLFG